MSREHISQEHLLTFCEDKVNLPHDKALKLRAQARDLRDRLKGYLAEHPDFTLKRMQLSGSLAKRTALSSLNDIDVACYISGADAPHDTKTLLAYLAERLRRAYPNFKPEQVKPQTYSVTVSFVASGLDVDVVPILYSGDPDWYGNLVSQDDGSFLKTSIPRHLDFAKARRQSSPDFAQVIRLIKYWARLQKKASDDFRFKSFMIELIVSKLCDDGLDLSDYSEALQHFFTYIARSGLRERIAFDDFYALSTIPASNDRVQIIDPVNADNNVARLYTPANADAIVEAALEAGDAIDAALASPTKGETVRYWQKVFGPAFRGKTMSTSFTITEASTFTITHAKYLASKIKTDLKRIQRLYDRPSDNVIDEYEAEAIAILKAGYLQTVTYGFQRGGKWVEPTLVYSAADIAGWTASDDDPGRIRPGADIAGAAFTSYLTYTPAWARLTVAEQTGFKVGLPFQRTGAAPPGINGYLIQDRTYSAGSQSLSRSSVRSL